MFPRPCSAADFDAWLKDITHWRMERKIRMRLRDGRSHQPAFQWAQSASIQPQMMVQDRYFYDPVAGKYAWIVIWTTWRSATAASMQYLIWPTYPNMLGIDNRNEHDMIRYAWYRGCAPDGRGLPPARRGRAVS